VQAQVGGTWRDWTPEISFEVDPLSPRLLTPQAAARLDNGCQAGDEIAWDFEWTGCRGADRYHLFVIGPARSSPSSTTTGSCRPRTPIARAPLSRPATTAAGPGGRGRTSAANGRTGPRRAASTSSRSTATARLCRRRSCSRPPDGAVFDQFPRTTTLTWSAVSGAASYSVDLQVCQPSGCVDDGAFTTTRGVTGTSYTFNFVGAQPGRWRVSSVNGGGVAGPPSGWRQFRFTR
jgi:hypothetical protein